jgi:biopolymer transport protein ExbD
MGMNVGGGGDYASEINITPLVDVVLVLLIIFMIIVPVMVRGYDVDIPGESAAPPPSKDRVEQVVLTIEPDSCPILGPVDSPGLPTGCTVRVNGDAVRVTDLAGFVAETFDQREGEDRVLFLAADDRLNYEGVMRILDEARSEAPGLRIGVVTEEG